MEPVERGLYWFIVVSVSFAIRPVRDHLRATGNPWLTAAAWVFFTSTITLTVVALNELYFGHGLDPAKVARIFMMVSGVCACVVAGQYVLAWFKPQDQAPEAEPEADFAAEGPLFDRLPDNRKGPLIRIEARDHRLNVVTEHGAATILMRMSDAEAMLAADKGLRVHRSHWVARDAVRAHVRREGRDFVVLTDGAEIPVSRGFRQAALDAGLISARA